VGRWPSEDRLKKSPAGKGEPVLYLDFDGVLHHEDVYWHPTRGAYINAHGHRLFEHVALLEAILDPYPEVRIVLSTSWVRQYGFSDTAKRLGPTLRAKCIGATWHTGMRLNELSYLQLSSGMQIVHDVARRQPLDWVAVDDDYDGWPEKFEANLVRSHPFIGISAPGVLQELRHKLQSMVDRQRGAT
jgi:hypothetical protein